MTIPAALPAESERTTTKRRRPEVYAFNTAFSPAVKAGLRQAVDHIREWQKLQGQPPVNEARLLVTVLGRLSDLDLPAGQRLLADHPAIGQGDLAKTTHQAPLAARNIIKAGYEALQQAGYGSSRSGAGAWQLVVVAASIAGIRMPAQARDRAISAATKNSDALEAFIAEYLPHFVKGALRPEVAE